MNIEVDARTPSPSPPQRNGRHTAEVKALAAAGARIRGIGAAAEVMAVMAVHCAADVCRLNNSPDRLQHQLK